MFSDIYRLKRVTKFTEFQLANETLMHSPASKKGSLIASVDSDVDEFVLPREKREKLVNPYDIYDIYIT